MKTLLLALALTIPTTFAHASSLSETCSSHDGSIRTGGGHGPFFTEVTVHDWSKGTETKVRDEDNAWNVEVLSEQVVKDESGGETCRDGMRAPWRRRQFVREVRITKADGGLFDKFTSGVSQDGKSVGGVLLCEWSVSNIMPCAK